jgi:hypothetical protein
MKELVSARMAWTLLTAAMSLGVLSGCDTPYTRSIRQLDETYEGGTLFREDYMRFVHEEEQWDNPHTQRLW